MPAADIRENAPADNILKFGVPVSEELLNALTEIGYPFNCPVTTLVPAILWEYVHLYRAYQRTSGPLDVIHKVKEAKVKFIAVPIAKIAKEATSGG